MKNKISFFVMEKDYNTGEIKPYDIMPTLYDQIYTKRGKLSSKFYTYDDEWHRIKITTKEQLKKFIKQTLMYYYWSKCEWEFIVIDWPYRTSTPDGELKGEEIIMKNRPHKIDVYKQIEPNLGLITDLLWEEVKNLINC